MKPLVYRFALIFILLTIVATIGLQLHWNVKNYEENKQRLLNDIQIALDNGVENYYAETAKKDILVFLSDTAAMPIKFRVFAKPPSARQAELRKTYRLKKFEKSAEIRIIHRIDEARPVPENISKLSKEQRNDFMEFNQRLVSAMSRDSIDFERLDTEVGKELKRKNIELDYDYFFRKRSGRKMTYGNRGRITDTLKLEPKLTYMLPGETFEMRFSNPVSLALGRGMTEIILSFIFSIAIISCLFYLLYIINRQKKIDEIRNDLISNITHEFKTPITTIGSAIEGIRSFNQADDKEKTERYLDISEKQLGKLQTMVEKLLDTATLDSGEIALKKEPVDAVALLDAITERHLVGATAKIAVKSDTAEPIIILADAFHLENAISNLIDNAVKYGGDEIGIRLERSKGQISIVVEDNGDGIDSRHRDQIFEKFYRIPTGNVHNVKGFGIGLYYSRKIAEKHGGKLELLSGDKTVFKMTLPDA